MLVWFGRVGNHFVPLAFVHILSATARTACPLRPRAPSCSVGTWVMWSVEWWSAGMSQPRLWLGSPVLPTRDHQLQDSVEVNLEDSSRAEQANAKKAKAWRRISQGLWTNRFHLGASQSRVLLRPPPAAAARWKGWLPFHHKSFST